MLFDEVKSGYTYDDMLLVTHYSEVKSRQDPDLYSVLVSDHLGFDVPIISANMNKITEGRMIQAMCDSGATAVLHRFLDPARVVEIVGKYRQGGQRRFGISIGVDESYYNSIFDKLSFHDQTVDFIVIDVAHGHHKLVCKTIKDVKERFNTPIIAGNVSTPEAAEYLVECGADSIKVGIGPGCFVPGSNVITDRGTKQIEDISVGEKVLSHRGKYHLVTATLKRKEKNKIYKINNIKCTGNHELYVLDKKYKEIVNDENINEYAQWISAENITKDFYLLKINK